MKTDPALKNEARLIVAEYSAIFSELEKLEMMASHLQLQRDSLMAKLDLIRERERRLIDNLVETDQDLTIQSLLT